MNGKDFEELKEDYKLTMCLFKKYEKIFEEMIKGEGIKDGGWITYI